LLSLHHPERLPDGREAGADTARLLHGSAELDAARFDSS
jgi:hypothetical protein